MKTEQKIKFRRFCVFASRNTKEILRDPLTLAFGLGFPLILLLLLTAIQKNIPVELFELGRLTPGIAAFGYAFLTLFSATLLAKDRQGSLLERLYTTPLQSVDYILGYMLPLLPMAVMQSAICYLCALLLGMKWSVGILWTILAGIPAAVFFIALGLLCGSVFNDKQVGGICGALLTNLTGWLSGTWFDLSLVGGAFEKIAKVFPFLHATEIGRKILAGTTDGLLTHFAVVSAWAIGTLVLAVLLFLRQMRRK